MCSAACCCSSRPVCGCGIKTGLRRSVVLNITWVQTETIVVLPVVAQVVKVLKAQVHNFPHGLRGPKNSAAHCHRSVGCLTSCRRVDVRDGDVFCESVSWRFCLVTPVTMASVCPPSQENLYRPACFGSMTTLVCVGRRWHAASSHHYPWPRLWQSKATHMKERLTEIWRFHPNC